MHAAQTDRESNTMTVSMLPTIWDRLTAAGVSGRYYFSDVPFTALWGTKHLDITQPYARFLLDCQAGTLPAVSFIDPRYEDEGSGTSGDDHPLGDIRVGERFLADVYEAITSSPAWPKTVFVINFDEWGGFFDHVPPGTAPDVNPANRRRGFRVPALVISPLARRRYVAHGTYDHTSVLKMIEWRWGLKPLTVRDAAARNLAEVLDFRAKPNLSAPRWNVPHVLPNPCQPAALPRTQEWAPLKELAARAGMLATA
jgi:phospholipase C